MSNNELRITQAENGFVLKANIPFCSDEDEGIFVISEKENDEDTLKEIFEKVSEWIGYSYDKYSKNNLNIKVSFDKKGDKVE